MPRLTFYLGRSFRFWINLSKIFFTTHLFFHHVGSLHQTIGPSMLPTLNVEGDWLWISHFHRRGRNIKVGDVVSFGHPLVPGEGACKRVVGMPGDFVMRDTPGSDSDMMIQVNTVFFIVFSMTCISFLLATYGISNAF